MSPTLVLFLFTQRASSLFQGMIATTIFSLILNLERQQQLGLLSLYLLLERCPLLSQRGLCEQLAYHGQAPLLGLYWCFDIVLSGCLGFFWGLEGIFFLLIAHAALLGRLFNLCLLFELPSALGRFLCCLLAMPWLILIACCDHHLMFLQFFLGGGLFVMLFVLIWLSPALVKWHLEPFTWEVVQ